MPLNVGDRVGSYQVLSKLGEGGMGEVYRARDTKLGRDVALKVLPTAFAEDPERLGRFEREARTLASLNHQNIGAIYGLEQAPAGPVLVMELVEGQTLEEISQGAGSSALDIARQIAEALEAAHDAGIVHRDLKPANVKVRPDGTVKVLDFGLAKALEGDGSDRRTQGPSDHAPTMTSPAMAFDWRSGHPEHSRGVTQMGMILGTASYMAPEQARGRPVDRRADIWAFGVVLYELLAGERLFAGDSIADVLAAVMTREPDLAKLPSDTPPAVRALITRCLERDPRQRLQAIGEARIVLSNPGTLAGQAATLPTAGSVRRRSPLLKAGLAAAAFVVIAAAVWLGSWLGGSPATNPVRKLDVAVALFQATDQSAPEISPDGRRILFYADSALWVRDLGSFDAVMLPSSRGAIYPAWSPDGTAVAYGRVGERVWRSPVDGTQPTVIGPMPDTLGGSGGLVWTKDDRIILSGASDAGLSVMPASGGVPEPLVPLDQATEADFHEISLLPDGVSPLYVTHVADRLDTIEVFTKGQRKVVFQLAGEEIRFPIYVAGHLVFERRRLNAGVWAVRFDLDRLVTEGSPFLVAPDAGLPSASDDGSLAFVRQTDMRRDLVWVEPTGAVETIVDLPERAELPRLSPDGRRAVFTMGSGEIDVWAAELETGALSRLTVGAGAFSPVWTPGGDRLLFSAFRGTPMINVYGIRSDGTGGVDRLTTADELQMPLDVSQDGRSLVIRLQSGRPRAGQRALVQLAIMPTDGSAPPTLLFQTPFDEDWASLSPDDRWVVYQSVETGQAEIAVRPIAAGAARVPVSTGGGRSPVWSADGRVIYFRQGTAVMASPVVSRGDAVEVGRPKRVFDAPLETGLSEAFDVSADGSRFLFIRQLGNERIGLVLNWPAEAARREGER